MAKRVRVSTDEDKISSLPDELLCHIISFLPLKEAYRTSILSTRWSKIYTSISNLNFEDSFKSRKSKSLSFMNFVDRMLFYHVGVVDKFRLQCGEFIESYRVDGWIRFALHNSVKELDLCVNCREFNMLPVRVFTCKTLVTLRLETYIKCKFVLKVPAKICLPKLKVLHLSGIQISDDDSIQRLFSSCSVLEELLVSRCFLNKPCKFYVCNPTLKRLTIAYNWGFHEDYEVLIDAPNLIYFKCYSLPKRFFLKNLKSLVEACINFGTVFNSHDSFMAYNTAATGLFQSISNVQSLNFAANFAELFLMCGIIPEFPKLTCLNLDGYFFVGWERVLPNLLACFPCLEALVFKVNHQNSGNINIATLPSKRFPSFLWSQLKTFQILSFDGKKDELQMIEYFLKNAKVLENFTVQIRERTQKQTKWRSKITKTLLNLPKASDKCKVLICK